MTPQAGKGQTILLAEDDPQAREIVASVLVSAGYQVIQVVDGQEFLDRFRLVKNRVALLLLDEDMPKRTGRQCLAKLRASGVNTPAIVMSGNSDLDLDPEADRRTVLLSKPFDLARLEELVGATLTVSES